MNAWTMSRTKYSCFKATSLVNCDLTHWHGAGILININFNTTHFYKIPSVFNSVRIGSRKLKTLNICVIMPRNPCSENGIFTILSNICWYPAVQLKYFAAFAHGRCPLLWLVRWTPIKQVLAGWGCRVEIIKYRSPYQLLQRLS